MENEPSSSQLHGVCARSVCSVQLCCAVSSCEDDIVWRRCAKNSKELGESCEKAKEYCRHSVSPCNGSSLGKLTLGDWKRGNWRLETVQYSTVQYCTVLYSIVQYSTVQYDVKNVTEKGREGKKGRREGEGRGGRGSVWVFWLVFSLRF